MSTQYKTPGVYIEEIPKFPPSVAQVETAIPIFIGYTQKRGMEGQEIPEETIQGVSVCEAVRITSLLEYETYFGTCPPEVIKVEIKEHYTAGKKELRDRILKASVPNPSKFQLYYHMQMYFANGGGPCYVVSIGKITGSPAKKDFDAGLIMAGRYDEPTLILMPEAIHLQAGDMYDLHDAALAQAADLQDRFVIMDCHGDDPSTLRDGTTGIGMNNLRYGAAYHPFLKTSIPYRYDFSVATNLDLSIQVDENDGDFADPGESPTDKTWVEITEEQRNLIQREVEKLRVILPPSAAVSGVYAQVDSSRGVWKAPANLSLQLVNGLTKRITEEENGNLNIDPVAGKSINAIRSFTGKGVLIWGARTLAGNDNEWRYISVRRFFNMVEESTKKASESFVFEPNDANTWVKVQGMLENYLTTLWRQGALQGAKPEHAFYVSVGLNKTMTALDVLEGRMIVEIGMAVVRPAEFIILRFSHKMAES